jgi:hypothetical protein
VTDLEELFRPLIDESAQHREPVATIEARVVDRRVRRRRQRAQYRFGAAFVAVALIATGVGVVHARDDGTGTQPPSHIATTTPPTPTTVAPSLAPTGWSTYDYGLARISIPPSWTTAELCPPAGGHALVFEVPGESARCVNPFHDVVTMRPLQSTDCGPCVPDASVNGIPYDQVAPRCSGSFCPSIFYVPSLEVSITFVNNVAADAILKTLTYSTYARLLQQPFADAPASWKTVTFDGFAVRVPSDWPTVDLAKTGGFCYPATNTVYVGALTSAPGCAPPIRLVVSSKASLQLEQDTGSALGTPTTAPAALEWHHNGLTLTRRDDSASTPLATELLLDVDGPHGHLRVILGLGPDPAVARGILGSLKPAE